MIWRNMLMAAAQFGGGGGVGVFVGGYAMSLADNETTFTIPLTSLTGGVDTHPSVGDIVVVSIGGQSVGPIISDEPSADFIVLGADTTYDARLRVSVFESNGTSTSVSISGGNGNNQHASAAAVQVWRGVDASTVASDAVEYGGTDTSIPSVSTIAGTAAGDVVLYIATNTSGSGGGHSFTNPGFYSPFVSAPTVDDGRESATAIGAAIATSSSVSLQQLGFTGTSSTATSCAALAITLRA